MRECWACYEYGRYEMKAERRIEWESLVITEYLSNKPRAGTIISYWKCAGCGMVEEVRREPLNTFPVYQPG